MAQSKQVLVGRTITGYLIEKDRQTLTLETDGGYVQIEVEGD